MYNSIRNKKPVEGEICVVHDEKMPFTAFYNVTLRSWIDKNGIVYDTDYWPHWIPCPRFMNNLDKSLVYMDNWSIIDGFTTNFGHLPITGRNYRLVGEVYNHPTKSDLSKVTTTEICAVDLEKKMIKTRNTTYNLLTMDPKYSKFLNNFVNLFNNMTV